METDSDIGLHLGVLTLRPLNDVDLLRQQHIERSAVRALAGLCQDSIDFAFLADVLGLDPAQARVDLPPRPVSPVLPPPLERAEKASTMPAGLRDLTGSMTAGKPAGEAPRRAKPKAAVAAAPPAAVPAPAPPPSPPAEPATDYRAPGRVVLVPDEQKPRCGVNGCPKHRGHVGRHRKPAPVEAQGLCGCGRVARHIGRCRTGETEQLVTKLTPDHKQALLTYAAELGQTPSAYIRSLILADLRATGRAS
jgi:hypothetical protein